MQKEIVVQSAVLARDGRPPKAGRSRQRAVTVAVLAVALGGGTAPAWATSERAAASGAAFTEKLDVACSGNDFCVLPLKQRAKARTIRSVTCFMVVANGTAKFGVISIGDVNSFTYFLPVASSHLQQSTETSIFTQFEDFVLPARTPLTIKLFATAVPTAGICSLNGEFSSGQ